MHLPTFEVQWADLRAALQLEGPEREKAIDPFFIATFLGVLAMGLVRGITCAHSARLS